MPTTIEGLDEIGPTLDDWAEAILRELGGAAVGHLKELEMTPDVAGAPHPRLAEMWTAGEPQLQSDGWHLEVFSRAESETFAVKRSGDTIAGAALLSILEGGAKQHFIEPKNAAVLAFPSPEHALQGAMFASRYGFSLAPHPGFATVFTKKVDHPGVEANTHVEQTADWLNEVAESMGQEAADRISATVK